MNTPISIHWTQALLRCSSVFVPKSERSEWLAEWTGELAYILQRREAAAAPHRAIIFCFGSFQDALLLWCENLGSYATLPLTPGSWVKCFAALIVLLVSSYLAAQLHIGFERAPHPDFYNIWIDDSLANVAIQVAIAFLSLPATTSMELGEYPANSFQIERSGVWRFWVFLFLKIVSVVLISHYIGLCMTHTAESLAILRNYSDIYCAIRDALLPIQFLATFAVCLYGLGWALRDQLRRCPVCLHSLSEPAIKGHRGRTFLSWGRSERACLSGHGLLLTPHIQTSWQAAQTWQHLDSFWKQFSADDRRA
jgi:hypothetical protein